MRKAEAMVKLRRFKIGRVTTAIESPITFEMTTGGSVVRWMEAAAVAVVRALALALALALEAKAAS